jgi:hypothetical protein
MTESNLPPLAILPSTLAANKDVKGRGFRMMIALAARRNSTTKLCCPSIKTLSKNTGIGVREVYEVLADLAAKGLIDWHKRRAEHGGLTSNTYVLHFMDAVDGVLEAQEGDVREAQEGDVQEAQEGTQHKAQEGDVCEAHPNKEDNKEDNSETNVLDFQGSSAKKPRQKKTSSKGTRIDPDWRPTKANIKYARDKGYSDLEISNLAEAFHNYWLASASPTALKADWNAGWRTWVTKDLERNGPPKSKRYGGQ